MIAEIIINSNVKNLNRIFDYNIPYELQGKVKIGSRVFVRFGNIKKLEEGFVIGIKESSEYKVKDIEREVSDLKVKANQDTNNFYILNYYIEINGFFEQSLDENLVSVTEWGNYYDMTIHDFETTIEPIIIKYDRSANEGGGIPEYVYNFTDVLKIEPQRLTEYYNIETGEKVVV